MTKRATPAQRAAITRAIAESHRALARSIMAKADDLDREALALEAEARKAKS